MGQLVKPKVHLLGYPAIDEVALEGYLNATQQTDFLADYHLAKEQGLSAGEILCSFYAKLCYKSLTVGKNANVQKTRSVVANLKSCFETGHGSVFEHAMLNFVVTDCSRVYTHEQVRHRVGVAYSQTSGRYCRLDKIDLVSDPILAPVEDMLLQHLKDTEERVYLMECKLGLRKPPTNGLPHPDQSITPEFSLGCDPEYREQYRWVPDDSFDFEKRKKITSAIRRIAPNGQANEMGMSLNLRSVRHLVQLRTNRFSEREIRDIFGQIYVLLLGKFPLLFHGHKVREVDGIPEVYGMASNPYDIKPGDAKALEQWSTEDITNEYIRRTANAGI